MDPELMRVLVPLGLFVFWALTKLSERNVKPLEIRNPRAVERGDPFRMGGGQESGRARAQANLRWSNQVSGSQSPGGADDIIILGSESRPVRPQQRKPQQRRQAQSQPRQQAPQKSAKKTKLADFTGDISRSMKESAAIQPLATIEAGSLLKSNASSESTSAASASTAPIAVERLRESLRDPRKLREALILSEILAPPLALRGKSRRA